MNATTILGQNDYTNNPTAPQTSRPRGLRVADLTLEEILDDVLRDEVARRQEQFAYRGPAPEEILEDEERRLAERALYVATASPEAVFDDELRAEVERRVEDLLVPEEVFDDDLRAALEAHLAQADLGAN